MTNGGGWTHAIVDAHPQHNNAFHNAESYPYPSYSMRSYGEDFFRTMYRWYLSWSPISGTSVAPYDLYLDEIEFINDPHPQNVETINSPAITYHDDTGLWEVSFNGKYKNCEYANATYEIRYSFNEITNENWNDATPALIQATPQFDIEARIDGKFAKKHPYATPVWASFRLLPEDEAQLIEGSRLYFAIKDIGQVDGNGMQSLPHINDATRRGGRPYDLYPERFDYEGDSAVLNFIRRIDYQLSMCAYSPRIFPEEKVQTVYQKNVVLRGTATALRERKIIGITCAEATAVEGTDEWEAHLSLSLGMNVVTVEAIDSKGARSQCDVFIKYIDFSLLPIVVRPEQLSAVTKGEQASILLQATDGTAPYTWCITNGTLPLGMEINAQTGEIHGTPDIPGEYVFTIRVADQSDPIKSMDMAYTLVVQKKREEGVLWSALEQTGDTYWKNSSVRYCARLLIDSNHIQQESNRIKLVFQGRNSGNYRIKKVSIAECDPAGAVGDVIDDTWTSVLFDGKPESAWEDSNIVVKQGEEKVSDEVVFTIDPTKNYYVTFKIIEPSVYLNPPDTYTELYFTNEDHSSDIDWGDNGHRQTRDYHALSKILYVNILDEGNGPDVNDDEFIIETISCSQCDHVVSQWTTDGDELNIKPGDTICLDGNIEYNNLRFVNINGTPDQPVIIKNCDEKVAFINPSGSSYGVKFEQSHDFKILGNGGGGDYGIKISTDNGFFLTLEHFTTDFEIAQVEIAGKSVDGSGFAGIGVKTSPWSDCELFEDPDKKGWVMENIKIHHNYIHDTQGEGMYIGFGFYNGRQEDKCPNRTYSHSIRGVRIYNNILENIGYDGLQIKNCDEDVAVYNNVINGYARDDETGAHDEGIYIGDGTTGKFYNNTIQDGGTGIMVHGMGNLDIYNNIIIDAHDFSMAVYDGPSVYRFPDGYFNIFNNTFHNTSTEYAFAFYNSDGGPKRLINNIFVSPNLGNDTPFFKSGSITFDDKSNNLFVKNISDVRFVDFSQGDLRLLRDSPAIDSGRDIYSEFGVANEDILGTSRPQGNAFDLGSVESSQGYVDGSGGVSGRIVTDVTGQIANITGAMVTIVETDQSTATDNNGSFSLMDVPEGTYTLKVEKNGFETQFYNNVSVSKNQNSALSTVSLSFEKCGIKGDINDDGIIDLKEAIHALQIVSD